MGERTIARDKLDVLARVGRGRLVRSGFPVDHHIIRTTTDVVCRVVLPFS
jgi:hypothetical protein